MNILETIIAHKIKEVSGKKELYPVKLLEKSMHFGVPCVSLKKYLQRKDKVGIIAEIKRRSPSKGMIHQYANIEQISIGYMQAGASALSVLTDTEFFGGKSEDLMIARKFNYCPILRKDFTIDEYQIVEAKSIGADAILLLANVLKQDQIKNFTALAHSLGLEVLLEIHEESELPFYDNDIDLVGINNRNLKTFEVDLNTSIRLSKLLPKEAIKISESGIEQASDVIILKQAGFAGFLIGETFMKHARPEKACLNMVKAVTELLSTSSSIKS